jgi:hypothetical protein
METKPSGLNLIGIENYEVPLEFQLQIKGGLLLEEVSGVSNMLTCRVANQRHKEQNS